MALTNKQNAAIALLIEVPEMPQEILAEKVGVCRTTIYNWRYHNEEFKEAYINAVKQKWEEAKDIALDRMVGLARGGDFKACKYILDTSEFAPVQKTEVKNTNNIIRVTISDE